MTVNFDHNRKDLTGIPEVVLAEPKTVNDLLGAVSQGMKRAETLLVTRITADQFKALNEKYGKTMTYDTYKRTAIIGTVPKNLGKNSVAILSGGTSDQPIVEEISICLRFFGIGSTTYSDVGVAGIHRHRMVLDEIEENGDYKLMIAVAGNEGALFTVISAQTKLPVVAVPTSIGYGFGGKGMTALQSALQSCSPGVVTVNIDNGFGAAAFARKLLSTTYEK